MQHCHENEIRYFSGIYAVRELPESEWKDCRYAMLKSHDRLRGYEALEDAPHYKKGEKVLICSTLVYRQRHKSK